MPTDARMAQPRLSQPGGRSMAVPMLIPQPVLVFAAGCPTAMGESLQPPGATSSSPAHTGHDSQGRAGAPACSVSVPDSAQHPKGELSALAQKQATELSRTTFPSPNSETVQFITEKKSTRRVKTRTACCCLRQHQPLLSYNRIF